MEVVSIFGIILAFAVSILMALAYPFTELARGMASNPSAHKRSMGALAISLIGTALLCWLISSCVP